MQGLAPAGEQLQDRQHLPEQGAAAAEVKAPGAAGHRLHRDSLQAKARQRRQLQREGGGQVVLAEVVEVQRCGPVAFVAEPQGHRAGQATIALLQAEALHRHQQQGVHGLACQGTLKANGVDARLAAVADRHLSGADAAQALQGRLQRGGIEAGGIKQRAAAAAQGQAKPSRVGQAQALHVAVHHRRLLQHQGGGPHRQGQAELGQQRLHGLARQVAAETQLPAGTGSQAGGPGTVARTHLHLSTAGSQGATLGISRRQQGLTQGFSVGAGAQAGGAEAAGGGGEAQPQAADGGIEAQLLQGAPGGLARDCFRQAHLGDTAAVHVCREGGEVLAGEGTGEAVAVGVVVAGAAGTPAHLHAAAAKAGIQGAGDRRRLGFDPQAAAALLQHPHQGCDGGGVAAHREIGQVLTRVVALKGDQVIDAVVAGVAALVPHVDRPCADNAFQGAAQIVLGFQGPGAEPDRCGGSAPEVEAQLPCSCPIALEGEHQPFIGGHPGQHRNGGSALAIEAECEAAAAAGGGLEREGLLLVAAWQRRFHQIGLLPAIGAGARFGGCLKAEGRQTGGQGCAKLQLESKGAAALHGHVAAADGRQRLQPLLQGLGQDVVGDGMAGTIQGGQPHQRFTETEGVGALPRQGIGGSPQAEAVAGTLAAATHLQAADGAAGSHEGAEPFLPRQGQHLTQVLHAELTLQFPEAFQHQAQLAAHLELSAAVAGGLEAAGHPQTLNPLQHGMATEGAAAAAVLPQQQAAGCAGDHQGWARGRAAVATEPQFGVLHRQAPAGAGGGGFEAGLQLAAQAEAVQIQGCFQAEAQPAIVGVQAKIVAAFRRAHRQGQRRP